MPLTLDEITEHEKRARREIAERECLLAALKVLRGYTAQGEAPTPTESPFLLADLIPFTSEAGLKELRASPRSEPEPAPPPPAEPERPPAKLPPPPRYMHPELRAFGHQYGSDVKVAEWGINRMTGEYTTRDVAALLAREGRPFPTAYISLVLTRLKDRGEIKQLKPSSGPIPGVYRKAENANPPAEETDGAISGAGE